MTEVRQITRMQMLPRKGDNLADSRREDVLEAAIDLFSRFPYEDVSIDVLARRAGVAHGMISYYFRNKRRLFAEAVRQTFADYVAFEGPRGDMAGSGDVVRNHLHRHFAYARAHPLRFSKLMRSSHADPEVAEILAEARRAAMAEVKMALGCPQTAPATLAAALGGWGAFVDATTQVWLDESTLDTQSMIELCVQALVSAVAAARGLYFSQDVESEMLSAVTGQRQTG